MNLAAPAKAEVTQNDILAAARALGFIENPPKGDVTIGIVYLSTSAQSALESNDLQKLLGKGLRVGGVTLKPLLVKLEDVPAANVQLIFLTSGIGPTAARVAEAAKTKRIPCITIDIPQVQNGTCMMGVRSRPKIEILVNRAAAASSGIVFAAVFRMMITEF